MTSLVSRGNVVSQENHHTRMKSQPKQAGTMKITQKQLGQTPGSRQALRSLKNSNTAQSSKTTIQKDTIQSKPTSTKRGPASTKKSHKRTVHVQRPVSEHTTLQAPSLPDIETVPHYDDYPSPFEEPSYFKNLTGALRNTVVHSSHVQLPNLDLPPLSVPHQQTPKHLESILDIEEPDSSTSLELPSIPDLGLDW